MLLSTSVDSTNDASERSDIPDEAHTALSLLAAVANALQPAVPAQDCNTGISESTDGGESESDGSDDVGIFGSYFSYYNRKAERAAAALCAAKLDYDAYRSTRGHRDHPCDINGSAQQLKARIRGLQREVRDALRQSKAYRHYNVEMPLHEPYNVGGEAQVDLLDRWLSSFGKAFQS